ncbi:COG4280 domain-containing protein [Acuticoccus yangtzensis]|uniref:COG4280 domain-containing protein n=1 Tax=Acuticoccus yangtzensis TaxID=1443441 RepID=UPI0009497D0F|nr:TMEM165/GDT1 family protein [Acuticoccus yangtzensis]
MIEWSTATPAIGSAFLASLVEVVEAFTIILAVATLRGWRPALAGTFAALAVLGALVLTLGPLMGRVPLHVLQLVIGVLLLLFGMGWLRKAALRAAGLIPLHDEVAIFARESAALSAEGHTAAGADPSATGARSDAAARSTASQDWIAGIAAFKAVLLEGLEVVFIVIAVGAGRGLLLPASLGALGACAAVLAVGAAVRKPLARVPENTLKFGVGVMLCAFGVFWTGEGIGLEWPGGDLVLFLLAGLFLAAGLLAAGLARQVASGAPAEVAR